ncbi:MAG: NAD(+)/NADH kinase, partial [Colwellia sp.]
LLAAQVDLILFAGGDGTARNVCKMVGDKFPVLGIPAGCKIHSGVYAVTPKAAGRVVEMMITNQLVTLTEADVMDIDESLFRDGIVKAKRYGEMQIPAELRYVQAVKSGGKELDELVLQDIAAHVINEMDEELFVIGSGSTTAFLMEELALDNTLLGVDLVQEQSLLANDVTEPQLWQAIELAKKDKKLVKLVITLIGGQGHIFGRGNQQLSPRVIRAIGKENLFIIATKAKLTALSSRPLITDTGDSELDLELSGYLPVITGYNDQVLYPVASPQ